MHPGMPTTMAESVAYIVHDVSQPLAAVLSNSESAVRWLTRDPPDLNEAKKAIERAIGSCHRAANFIRNIRDLIQESPPLMKVDMNGILKDALNHASVELCRHSVALETNLVDGPAPIRGYRIQLERLVTNIIVNSIEAMIVVEDRERKLRIGTQLNEVGILVTVEDSGTGVDPGHINRIFDPYFTTKRDGMGLGLSICRSIVEWHSGRMWATPNLPHGSVFSFTIPRS
jgi:signal transduction histidine kinase